MDEDHLSSCEIISSFITFSFNFKTHYGDLLQCHRVVAIITNQIDKIGSWSYDVEQFSIGLVKMEMIKFPSLYVP